MLILTLLAWPVIALTTIGLAFWLIVGLRVSRMLRVRPTIRAGLNVHADPEDAAPALVSIIVPAHNEERVIDRCARSLRDQSHESIEMVFVLDRCTDGTLEILKRHAEADDRIVLVENDSCPDDWAGKCNAARVGAEQASGVFLLFTDADTWFDPHLVRASIALAREREIDLLSLLSTLTSEHAFERIAQPVASMNLVRMYPIERVNRDDDSRPFANGQFMLFQRGAYESIGGHAAVKDDLLEDIAFARKLTKAGGRCGVYLADGMLTCSMYESLAAFRRGWKRIFIEACKRKPGRLRKNAWRVFASGVMLSLVQLVGIGIGATLLAAGGHASLGLTTLLVIAVGWSTQLVVLAQIYALGGAPRRAALTYPLGAWIVGRTMLEAAADLEKRRPIRWGGREYILDPR